MKNSNILNILKIFSIGLIFITFQGCLDKDAVKRASSTGVVSTDGDNAPVASALSPASFDEDVASVITLSYTDSDDDLASNCAVTSLSNISVTQACSCTNAGVCTVGVKGSTNYNGAASFKYVVRSNSKVSNLATVSLTIDPVDDAPVSTNITPSSFNENTQSIITLNYSDVDSDLGVSCSISNLTNVTETQACACDGAGVCTVGVTGTLNYFGVAGFDYEVTANGQTSNVSSATFMILNLDFAPVADDISPAAFNEDTQSVIALSYSDADGDLATACTLSNLSNVTVTQACACAAGVCTVGVTGTSNYNGAASFDYTVTANGQTSAAATSTLSINAVDDAPVVSDITPAAFNEDTQTIVTLSYTDADNNLATACTISNLSNVTVTQACACDGAGVCTVGLTGTANYNGSASFDYTVTANGATSATAETASLTINNTNDAPVVADISPAAFNEDTQSVITLSYTDADSDLATACTISNLSNVTVTQACACNGAGVCTVGVTGTANYSGAASFDYTVTANGQTAAVAETASLTINNADDAPVVADISPAAFNEDTQSVVTLSYTDTENDLATACTISNLSNVTVTQACACDGAGVCTVGVTGTANYNGSASFDYTVTANGATSAAAETASLTINNVDDAPVVADISPAAFNENTQSVITLSYTDADSDLATACTISNLSNVTVTQACACNGAGVCTVGVTGTLNYNGAASFDYTVTANGATSAVAETATLSITNVDNAPVVADISPAAFNEDTQSVITLSYTDADNDKGTACTISNLSNVTVTQACACDGAGVCTVGVTGTANYNGAASFDYTVTANGATSAVAETASLTINNVDDAPVVADISPAAFSEDTQSIITLSYTDADNDKGTACTISNLSNVTVTQACACDGAGVCTVGVTGTANYVGAASFDYTVTANGQTSAVAETASLTINNANDAPVVADISPAAFNEDTQSVITLSYTDADNDKATACTISNLSNVTVTQACACDGAGVCTVGVTGTANYNGAASFDYTVTANAQTSAVAETASLTINNVDDAPVVADISPAAFNEDTQSIITLSYTDADSDKGTACTISNLSNVTVTQACACDGAGVCTVGVTGTANYAGAASFDYTVTANGATAAVAETASLTINNANDAPVVADISPAAFNEDTQSVITLSYTDADSDLATACTISNLSNVTVTQACACNGAGVCTVGVTGSSNYNGAASFDYTVTANGQTAAVAETATLSITAIDDAPVANNITPAAFNEDTNSVITLSYTDPELDLASSCTTSNLSNITVISACSCTLGTCTVTVKGTANYNGVASFDYTVTANGQTSSPAATASLTIDNVDDAPVVADISPAAFNEDTQSIITLSYTDADSDLGTACTISNLSNVTVTQACACNGAGVCTVGVTGTANYTGAASFDYTVTANGATSAVAETASLTINNADDAPVVADISPAAFNEDTQSVITLSYTDADNDKATACTISNLSNVTVTQACACDGAGVCTVGVTGTANYNGSASFDYTVTANGATSAVAETASLTINNVDDAPVVADISPAAFNEDTQSVITLSYTDADSDKGTACTISNLSNVTVTQACACDGAGVCTVGVTGTANYTGSASFDYTVTANGATAAVAETASLTINNADDAPVVADISPAAFNEDTQSVITLSYTDADSDLATACTISNLSNVTVTQACACNGAGVCTVGVTGTANYNGAASFDYTVTANGATSAVAETASLTINNVADAPVVADISPAAFNEDTQSVITLSYTDADSDLATACTISNLSNVTVTQACACDGAGVCTVGVTGTANYTGAASFDYTVTANGQTAAVAETASLTINNADDAPVVADISPAAFNEDTQSVITLSYTDADNDKGTACTISNLSNVTVTQACACDGAGVCTVGVTGTANYNGVASFDYTVTANGATSATAETATLSITNVDDAPVVADISPAAFNEDTQSVITLSYTDADNDKGTACTISNLSNVTVTQACACDGAGVCTVGVTGTANYTGAASFDYTVTANGATAATAETATLSISNINDAPVVADISPAAFNEDTQSVITLSYTDADSDLGTACTISNLSNVTVTQACACDGAGVCTVGVTGTANYNGSASFDYTVTANGQTSAAAETASLTINNVDDTPVAADITPASFNEDTQSIITLSYTDADNDKGTACTISNLSNVTVTQACACDGVGVCTVGVTGTANYVGAASFDYTVTANGATSAAETATLDIDNLDDAPVAIDLTPAAFDEDVAEVITLSYTDADFDSATACATSNLSNITVTSACSCALGTCQVTVKGTANYNGVASFDYTVTANGQTSAAETASLTISAVDDAPVSNNISPAAFNEDTQSVITLNYTDVESHSATACTISNLSNVTVTQACACAAGTCTVGVTGTANYNGAASFDYTVTANGLTSASAATATLSITAVAEAPVASNISPAAFNEDTQSVITLSYTDNDGDLGTSCSLSSLTNVTETQACACDGSGVCTVGVTGTANYNGAASFAYTVTANGQASNSATATLSINAVADAPVASNISPAAFNEDTQSVITLSYTDAESDLATACTISNLVKVTVTQACSCNGGGVCTVGVTGTADSYGSASFDYTVTANGQTSASAATASLTITPISDYVALQVDLFPAQDLILPIDAAVNDVVSDVSSAYYKFHRIAAPTYSIVANTGDNNFDISSAGVITVDNMTNLTAGQTYNITVRADDPALQIYDEKTISITVIATADIVYYDPDWVGTESGTRAEPYNTLAEAYAASVAGDFILQKRGTTATFSTVSLAKNDLTYGAYGVGVRPILDSTVAANSSINTTTYTGLTFRDLDIRSVSTSGSMINMGAGDNIKIINIKLSGGYQAIGASATTNLLIQNVELERLNAHGIYLTGAVTNAELSYNYIHEVNEAWNTLDTSNNKAIHINSSTTNLNIHHNIFDMTANGKGGAIYTTTSHTSASFKYNYVYGSNAAFKAINANYTMFGIWLELTVTSNNSVVIAGNKLEDLENGLRLTKLTSISVHSNEFFETALGMRFGADIGGNLYNNLFKDSVVYDIYFTGTSTGTVNTKNNIHDSAVVAYLFTGSATVANRIAAANTNLYAAGNLIASGYANLAAWQVTGHDANGAVGTPNYYNEGGLDFHIIDNGSAGLNAGGDFGLDFDIEGQAYDATPHLGPYQVVK